MQSIRPPSLARLLPRLGDPLRFVHNGNDGQILGEVEEPFFMLVPKCWQLRMPRWTVAPAISIMRSFFTMASYKGSSCHWSASPRKMRMEAISLDALVEMSSLGSAFIRGHGFYDVDVLHLDQPVAHHVVQRGQDFVDTVACFIELNDDRQVLDRGFARR